MTYESQFRAKACDFLDFQIFRWQKCEFLLCCHFPWFLQSHSVLGKKFLGDSSNCDLKRDWKYFWCFWQEGVIHPTDLEHDWKFFLFWQEFLGWFIQLIWNMIGNSWCNWFGTWLKVLGVFWCHPIDWPHAQHNAKKWNLFDVYMFLATLCIYSQELTIAATQSATFIWYFHVAFLQSTKHICWHGLKGNYRLHMWSQVYLVKCRQLRCRNFYSIFALLSCVDPMAAADATDVAQRTRVFTHGWNVDIQRAVALNEIGHAMKHIYIYYSVFLLWEYIFSCKSFCLGTIYTKINFEIVMPLCAPNFDIDKYIYTARSCSSGHHSCAGGLEPPIALWHFPVQKLGMHLVSHAMVLDSLSSCFVYLYMQYAIYNTASSCVLSLFMCIPSYR